MTLVLYVYLDDALVPMYQYFSEQQLVSQDKQHVQDSQQRTEKNGFESFNVAPAFLNIDKT